MTNTALFKSYLVRAIFQWCRDHHYEPYLLIADDENCLVPKNLVDEDDEVLFTLHQDACLDIKIDKHFFTFQAQLNDHLNFVAIPIERIKSIYAAENQEGLYFDVEISTLSFTEYQQTLALQGKSKPIQQKKTQDQLFDKAFFTQASASQNYEKTEKEEENEENCFNKETNSKKALFKIIK